VWTDRSAGREVLFSPAGGGAPGVSRAALDQAVQSALHLHQRGKLQEAADGYRWVLAIDPDHAEANHLLGLALHQAGRNAEAVVLIAKAVHRSPKNATYHANLGVVLKVLNRLDEAVASYRQSLAIDPKPAQVHSNLGVALLDLDRADDAAAAQRQAIARDRNYAEAHANLGMALDKLGQREEAVAAYRRAIALRPNYANAYLLLAAALGVQGRFEEALQNAQKAVALQPANTDAHHTLGGIFLEMNRLDDAAISLRKAVQLKPTGLLHRKLGRLFADLNRGKEAADELLAAIHADPADAEAYVALGNVLFDLGNPQGALESYSKAGALKPDDARSHVLASTALVTMERIEEGQTAARMALAIDDDNLTARSLLLFASNYDQGSTADSLAADANAYGRVAARLRRPRDAHSNNRDPGKRLKIGFVSGDFYDHPVAQFIKAVLLALNHESLELFAYAVSSASDATTEMLKARFDHWEAVRYRTDEQLEAQILEDGIDILVDLSGHSGASRLTLFARKPAPVAVTWLGYSGTTGLDSIDYILGDRFVAPPGSESQFSETVWRMPDAYLSFGMPEQAPDVATLPALTNGFVTFGSFNNSNKLSPATLALWARVIEAVPNSRLLLKSKVLEKPEVAARVLAGLKAAGADTNRVDLVGLVRGTAGHLATYGRIDIGLDPFPYNGTTTTCEALWMGVPVISRAGDRFIARVGESLLNSSGLGDWVAGSERDYIARAVAAASDIPALAALRQGLRAQMATSPLCDAPRFAQNLESAFREMWLRWCDRQSAQKSAAV